MVHNHIHHPIGNWNLVYIQYLDESRLVLLTALPFHSYFFAETLKYLSLTFLEEDPWPLDKFVFTTEAHPLPVFTWTDSDKSWFRIS
jgi:hypothetical protein